ncbi:MAG: glutathione S-transferase family protein [Steroidobacteraceae bacterium]
MLTLYGQKASRALRCMWVMEELGLKYQSVPLKQNTEEVRTTEYLALNSAAKIPTLVDGDFVVSETIAINAYLASKHPGALWPDNPQGVAKVIQWSSWAVTELEPPLVAAFREGRRPEQEIDKSRIEGWRAEALKAASTVLEPHLAKNKYLLPNSDFTLADLNVAMVVNTMVVFKLSFAELPHTDAWLKRCLSRPAFQKLVAA